MNGECFDLYVYLNEKITLNLFPNEKNSELAIGRLQETH